MPDDLLDADTDPVAGVAARLRATLTPLVEQLAGSPPRPVRLTRENPGPGLDKSLASRLVQAAKAGSDLEFLHRVPSPTGLRMLLERAEFFAPPALVRDTAQAVDAFQGLLDGLPGGRQALDARLGESQASLRDKREQIARQASFKAVSFLFGHYCETLATALFVFPSATPGRVDVIEVHRRIGLRRLVTSTPLPLLSLYTGRMEGQGDTGARMGTHTDPAAEADAAPDAQLAAIDGRTGVRDPHDFLLPAGSSAPLPPLRVEREGQMSTFLLPGDTGLAAPLALTTAYRLLRCEHVAQHEAYNVLRTYMLHTPCRRVVRDVWLAAGLWPDATPQVAWYLPSPSGTPAVVLDPAQAHYRRVQLSTRIEQRPAAPSGFELAGVADHAAVMTEVLRAAGEQATAFRGWRCEITYPVPLVEMNVAFRFEGAARGATG